MKNKYDDSYLLKIKEVVDRETGEIEVGLFIPEEQQTEYVIQSKKKMESCRRKAEAKQELKDFNETVGSFTLNIEKSVKKLFENEQFSDAEKVHIMYLGSYVNYEGFLMTKNNKPITKEILKTKLKIKNKKRFYEFYNKLVTYEILSESKGKLFWDKNLCFKGSPKSNGTSSKQTIKTFDSTIQTLYDTHSPKSLCIVFKVLPFINKFHNVLCQSSQETDYDNCNPLSINDLTKLLNEKDSKNLKQKLLRLKLDDEFIFSIRNTGSINTIVVNPSLVWQSPYAPSSNLIGDFNIAKAKLLEEKQNRFKSNFTNL